MEEQLSQPEGRVLCCLELLRFCSHSLLRRHDHQLKGLVLSWSIY